MQPQMLMRLSMEPAEIRSVDRRHLVRDPAAPRVEAPSIRQNLGRRIVAIGAWIAADPNPEPARAP